MSFIIGSVTINKNPALGTDWWPERMNQKTIITADAGHVTYDNGPNVIRGIILIRNVVRTEGDSLIAYVRDTAVFQKNSFTINISTLTNTDLGAGKGTNITTVYWAGGNTLKNYFRFSLPDNYEVRFPYWKAA